MNLTPEIINLGALAVVFIYFIDKLFSYLRNKKDKNSNDNILKILNALKNNDLSEISKKIDRLEDKIDYRFDEMIKILIEIKEKIKK
jgi:uncharacterized protein Yka (UPF0111/DUF47 family)